MKPLNKLSIAIALYTLVVITGPGMAHATQVNIKNEAVPTGADLGDSSVLSSGCETTPPPTISNYQFVFWDNQGTISFTATITICTGSSNGTAIAWYVPTGSCQPGQQCGCPPSGCYVSTFGYSIHHHEFLASGTPIALVTPNSPVAWTAGSNVVNTSYAAESISAKSALAFSPYKADPFRFWQELGTSAETPVGVVYNATLNTTAWVVAFYGPDPCKTLRTELQVCEYEFPGDPKACAPIAAELNYCEQQNRELP